MARLLLYPEGKEHGPGIFNRNRSGVQGSEVKGKEVRYSETLGLPHKSEPCTILQADLIGKQTRNLFIFYVIISKKGVEMIFLCDSNKQVLMRRLEMKGLGKSTIPGFICSLKSCLLDNPDMNHLQANERLQFLGWDDFDLDYHTLQLAIASFEAEGF